MEEYDDPLPLGGPVYDLGMHVDGLMNFQTENGDGFDQEFNFIEKKSESESFFGEYGSAVKPANRAKNRYSNVLPIEGTRVELLSKEDDTSSDYINANWINGLVPGSEKQFITTQGPLPETVEDFWRMVYETRSNVIAMLTSIMEKERVKCAYYWPGGEDDSVGSAFTFEDMRVTLKRVESRGGYSVTTRVMDLEEFATGEVREVTQYQYTEWPDHGLPDSAETFRDMLHNVDKMRVEKSPIIVHCSAGIGRTGTFCTVHSMIEELRMKLFEHPDDSPAFNVLNTVLHMRAQRVGMVQTKEQYMFCYKALLEETQNLKLHGQTPFDSHRFTDYVA